MRSDLHELPAAINEPIGTTGAEIVITHVGTDSDGLPRARVNMDRGDLLLASDVVRLGRDADRRGLVRAALKEEASRAAEAFSGNGAEGSNGDGPGATGDGSQEGANGDNPAVAGEPVTENLLAPLTKVEIERALLRAAEAIRAVGMPPESRYGHPHLTPVQAQNADAEADASAAEGKPERPDLIIRDDLAEFADEAEQLLLAMPSHGIYKRSRMLVRVVREEASKVAGLTRPPGAPVIEAIGVAYLRDRLARPARWFALAKKGVRPAIPPMWVPETLLARGEWPFLRLEGVVETPTLRPDGTILETPGYDPATGFLYEPNAEFPPIPSEPSQEDVMAAIRDLLEPFSEFPFVAESDRCATLAAVLTLVARTAIDGPTPLFAIRATTPGTGKGLLASVVSLIGSGRAPTLFAVSREDEEVRKRLLTIGIEGTRCVLLDNVEGTIGSPSLAAALTALELTDRLLGTNRLVTVPMQAVWLTTGNNMAFRGDLGRRVLPIDLDPKVEFPEDRTFDRPNLASWVRQERPRLVVAALTLLRAFHVAGRPDHGQSRVGSFEGWDSVIRAALVWLGFEDPCAGRRRVRTESDTDLEALGAVLEAWRCAFGSEPQTLARAIESAFGVSGNEELAAALAGLDSKSDGRQPNPRPVGDRFRRWKGRIAGGLVLETDEKKEHGAVLWRVARVGA